jgi:Phytanoyl-CoA dioxygenase (PhyH)
VDVAAGIEALRLDGLAVFRDAVPIAMCDAVIDAIASECGVQLDDPGTWSRISTEIDQVPLWAHQSQWDIRQLPLLYEIWSRIWDRAALWADMNSCRVTPPWREGIADALPIHFDVDPRDNTQQWSPGVVALTDAPEGHGGFCCVPTMFRDRSTWPSAWPISDRGVEYRPDTDGYDIVEVPMRKGDLLVFDSHLPHGTVRNHGSTPRASFYVQLHPCGTETERVNRLADVREGRCPSWWRWKPGHDRLDPAEPALTELGRRLLGSTPW